MPQPALWRRPVVILMAMAIAVVGLPQVASAQGDVHHLSPGQSLSRLLASVAPGDTVVVRDGIHPRQVVSARFSEPVTVVGESRTGAVLEGLELSNGASNLVFRELTVRTPGPSDPNSAIKVFGGANQILLDRLIVEPLSHGGLAVHNWGGAPHDIELRDSVVNGASSSGTWSGRAVYVGDVVGADSSGWPARISVVDNDLGTFWADIIHISGATDMTVAGNHIHDVMSTDDHNDGLQSVASLRLRVVGNVITSPADPGSTTIPPDQAIILGHAKPAREHLRVVDTYVANNVVHHWRGKPILLHGTDGTRIVNNTVAMSGPASDRFAAPSVTVYGPAGAPQNHDVKIWNNVLDRLWIDADVKPSHVGSNCIQVGATAGDVSADPKFADTTATFALSSTSPCIDVGLISTAWETPTTDRLGALRDAAPDAGAWEHVSPEPDISPSPDPMESSPEAEPSESSPEAEPSESSPETDAAPQPEADPVDIDLTATSWTVHNRGHVELSWSGATTASVDVIREGRVVSTTPNDGTYIDTLKGKRASTYEYVVCDAGATLCSSPVSISF